MAFMWQALAAGFGGAARVFIDVDEAEAWLRDGGAGEAGDR